MGNKLELSYQSGRISSPKRVTSAGGVVGISDSPEQQMLLWLQYMYFGKRRPVWYREREKGRGAFPNKSST